MQTDAGGSGAAIRRSYEGCRLRPKIGRPYGGQDMERLRMAIMWLPLLSAQMRHVVSSGIGLPL